MPRVLKSVSGIADEIIIVDTGSTDKTKSIARKFTKKVFDFEWCDNFALARNFAFSKGTKDFLMWLDADDIILESDRAKIIELKNTLSKDFSAVTMRYDSNESFYAMRGRLFNRETNPQWHGEVHEYVPLVGSVLQRNDIAISHKPDSEKSSTARNLKIYEKVLARDGELDARGKYYYARELRDVGRLDDAIKYFNLFLDEGKGWVEDNIGACFALANCYAFLGDAEGFKKTLLKSFEYDAPRPEIACMLGYHYKDKKDFLTAANWFNTALSLPKSENGFVMKDYKVFIPALELAVCFDNLGQHEKANFYNEIAGKEKPQSPEYLFNKKYFTDKRGIK